METSNFDEQSSVSKNELQQHYAKKIYLVRRYYEDGRYFESDPLSKEQVENEVWPECNQKKCKFHDLLGEHEFGYPYLFHSAYKLVINTFDTPEDFEKMAGYYPEAFRSQSNDMEENSKPTKRVPDVSQYQKFMESQEALSHKRAFKLKEAVQVSLTEKDMSDILAALDHTHLDLLVDNCENHLALEDKMRHKQLVEMDFIKALQSKVYKSLVNCQENKQATKLNFFSGREALTICHCLRQQNHAPDIENKLLQRMPNVLKATLVPPKKENKPEQS